MAVEKPHYTIVGDSSFYDRMFHMYHRLGIQSNIIVSARYRNPKHGDAPLSKPAVIAALRETVAAHPRLQIVSVIRPSKTKPGQHGMEVAALHSIDVEGQIEWRDEEEEVTAGFLEEMHNTWDWTDNEPKKPFWKIVVLGRRSIVFVFDHFVADGMSGTVFHREFAAALNRQSPKLLEEDGIKMPSIVEVDPEKHDLPKEPLSMIKINTRDWEAMVPMIVYLIFQYFLQAQMLWTGLPKSRPLFTSITESATDASQRTQTGVASLRIPAAKMGPILKACRAHGVTFTPLMVTMLLATLSADYYPSARYTGSRVAASILDRLPLNEMGGRTESGTMVLAATSHDQFMRLANYRRLVRPVRPASASTMEDKAAPPSKPDFTVDADAFWAIAKKYKDEMTQGVKGPGLRAWKRAGKQGPNVEDLLSPGLFLIGLMTRYSMLVSNIGAYANDKSQVVAGGGDGGWLIDDMQFSAASTNGNEGYRGMIFNIVGVKGGDTVVNASFERDVVPREIAEGVMSHAMARIESLLNL